MDWGSKKSGELSLLWLSVIKAHLDERIDGLFGKAVQSDYASETSRTPVRQVAEHHRVETVVTCLIRNRPVTVSLQHPPKRLHAFHVRRIHWTKCMIYNDSIDMDDTSPGISVYLAVVPK